MTHSFDCDNNDEIETTEMSSCTWTFPKTRSSTHLTPGQDNIKKRIRMEDPLVGAIEKRNADEGDEDRLFLLSLVGLLKRLPHKVKLETNDNNY
jgi:hypothetical protein